MEILWFILGVVFGGLAGGLFIANRMSTFVGRAMNAVVYFEAKYKEVVEAYELYVKTVRGGNDKLN